MSFTSKEKKLLIFLIVLATVAIYFYFGLIPILDKMQVLKTEIEVAKNTYNTNLKHKDLLKNLNNDIQAYLVNIQKFRSQYPPAINYEEVLVRINQLSLGSGFNLTGIAFSEVTPVNSNSKNNTGALSHFNNALSLKDARMIEVAREAGFLPKEEISKVETKIPDGSAYVMKIGINGTCSNEQLEKFLKNLKDLSNKVTVNDVSISQKENDVLNISMSINFLGVMDKNAGEYKLIDDGTWIPYLPAKKPNIFGIMEEITVASQESFAPIGDNYYQVANFAISIYPYGNGMTRNTVAFSAKGDTANITEIHGDKDGFENVDLYLTQENGKYKFMFKTETESYPTKNYLESEAVEFKPIKGKLLLYILSQKRTTLQDKSGVNLSIRNNTGVNLDVIIKSDDPKLSRVKFIDNKISKNTYKVQYIN